MVTQARQASVLAVGVATVDVIVDVDTYPPEDSKTRARAHQVRCGGNAANTLIVLAQLGCRAALAATLSRQAAAAPIDAALEAHGIDRTAARLCDEPPPVSYIVRAADTGSRTIVHHRTLPEYTFEDFARIDLGRFDWVHFETRNVPELERMLQRVRADFPHLPCSLEVEKPRPGFEAVLAYPQLLFLPRALARALGFDAPEAMQAWARSFNARAELVCPWGEAGAHAWDRDDRPCHEPAQPPARVIDTIGAGDAFHAAVIAARVRGEPLADALAQAARLAGRKCGREGLAGLGAN